MIGCQMAMSCRDGDDWMSDGNELQRSDDAATGNVRRPTVVNAGPRRLSDQ